jgi:UDP-N-acetyl-D-glucosamine dehydrogenase
MHRFDVSVVGLGFAGLPSAVAVARTGLHVVGLDSSADRVQAITDVTPGCGQMVVPENELRLVLSHGLLRVTHTTTPMPPANTHILCLPTPRGTDGEADVSSLLLATDRVAAVLRRGDLVLVQSTCPPGTIERKVVPRLINASGLIPGSDYSLAYSPVRIDPGNWSYNLRNVPRVVAGATPRCLEIAVRFLERFTDHLVPVDTIDIAEMTKVFENTFRLVNISLVNELATVCRASGVDFNKVLDAAATKPYGFMRHEPSPGAGGDCIPVSASIFASTARQVGVTAPVVESAINLNEIRPISTMERIRHVLALNNLPPLHDSRILVVGVTYKPDVPSTRESVAVRILKELRQETQVNYYDPYVPSLTLSDGTVLHNTNIESHTPDLILVLTRHRRVINASIRHSKIPVVDCSTGEPHLAHFRQRSFEINWHSAEPAV